MCGSLDLAFQYVATKPRRYVLHRRRDARVERIDGRLARLRLGLVFVVLHPSQLCSRLDAKPAGGDSRKVAEHSFRAAFNGTCELVLRRLILLCLFLDPSRYLDDPVHAAIDRLQRL